MRIYYCPCLYLCEKLYSVLLSSEMLDQLKTLGCTTVYLEFSWKQSGYLPRNQKSPWSFLFANGSMNYVVVGKEPTGTSALIAQGSPVIQLGMSPADEISDHGSASTSQPSFSDTQRSHVTHPSRSHGGVSTTYGGGGTG